MSIKLIALDLDGTTLNSQGHLSEKTKEALDKAIDKGVHVVVATGRCYSALPLDLFQVEGLEYVITSNGAQITDLTKGQVIYSNCICQSAIDPIEELLTKYDFMVEVFVEGNAYIEKRHYDAVVSGENKHRSKSYVEITRQPVEGLMEFMQANREKIENINIFFDDMGDKADMKDPLHRLPNVTITSSFDNNWEIGGQTTSKGNAVLHLSQSLDIDKDHIMACGDSPNDGSMLQVVGVPVAVANAKDVIKDLAVFVTSSNDEHGVAKAIEKYVL